MSMVKNRWSKICRSRDNHNREHKSYLNVKSHLISAYAPTLENAVRNQDEARIFYEQLS